MLAYFEICDNIVNKGWTRVKGPDCVVGPYAYKGDQWVGYDDPESIKYKMEFVKKMELGGAMVWDVSTDDFKGKCGQGKYPIISAMKRFLTKE